MKFRIKATSSKWRKFAFYWLALLSLMYFPFNVYRFYEFYRQGKYKNHLEEFILAFFFIIVRWQGAWLNLVCLAHDKGIATLLSAQQSLNMILGKD
jgi:hypothetical protein